MTEYKLTEAAASRWLHALVRHLDGWLSCSHGKIIGCSSILCGSFCAGWTESRH
jgi:hypothetical protein